MREREFLTENATHVWRARKKNRACVSIRVGTRAMNLHNRKCVRNLDLWVQMHPGELWVSKQWVYIVLEASKSEGAKGDVPKHTT